MIRHALFAALAVLALFAMAAPAPAAPHCKKGIACGNSCISASKVCHIPAAAPAASASVTASSRRKMEDCFAQATAQRLTGDAWQSFMLDCLRPR